MTACVCPLPSLVTLARASPTRIPVAPRRRQHDVLGRPAHATGSTSGPTCARHRHRRPLRRDERGAARRLRALADALGTAPPGALIGYVSVTATGIRAVQALVSAWRARNHHPRSRRHTERACGGGASRHHRAFRRSPGERRRRRVRDAPGRRVRRARTALSKARQVALRVRSRGCREYDAPVARSLARAGGARAGAHRAVVRSRERRVPPARVRAGRPVAGRGTASATRRHDRSRGSYCPHRAFAGGSGYGAHPRGIRRGRSAACCAAAQAGDGNAGPSY